tara:strand:- start:13 stop:930 length:918 start_codon:yes stop_codon:yes gene_type:complete
MQKNYFKKVKILDGGMGQELLSRGLISYGTLWSASALISEKNHHLVLETHKSFINAGADVIVTNNFSARKVRLDQNNVGHLFNYMNKKAGEIAIKARETTKKDVLIAGGLPPQNGTYVVDERDSKIISENLKKQADIISPYIDFFYLDVFSSGREIELALNILEKLNKPVLVGIHIKKNGKLPSNESLTDIVKKYKNNNWLGIVLACVSMDTVNYSINEIRHLNLPFGFKVNLWAVEEPLPVHKFNKSKPNEIGQNPNVVLGSKKEITGEHFYKFAKNLKDKGATILGGCCETKPIHISALSRLK